MSEYNHLLDFNAPQLNLDAEDLEYPDLFPDLDQSAAWTAPFQPSVGSMGGDTAAQLQLDVDSAAKRAESLGSGACSRKHECAVCHEPYPTDSALHQHAIEAQHQAYKCQCGTGFNKNSALKRHIDTQHSSNTFACLLCRDEFIRKDKLKDHWRHYHKISAEGVKFLAHSQELQPRGGAPSRRRRRGPVPKAAALSGPPVPGISPARAPAFAGPSVWPFPASTGQQYANLPEGPSVSANQFVPSADVFAAAYPVGEDFSLGTLDNTLLDQTWAAGGFDGFNLEGFPL